MRKKLVILIVALFLTLIASYMGVKGLAGLFGGGIVVILMAIALEISKITLLTVSHNNRNKFSFIIKFYMVLAIIILYSITSIGIFGNLKNFSIDTIMKLKNNELKKTHIEEKYKTLISKKEYLDSLLTRYENQRKSYQELLFNINSNSHISLDTSKNRFWASYNIAKLNLQNKAQLQKQINNELDRLNSEMIKYESELSYINDSLFKMKLQINNYKLDYFKIAKDIGAFYSFAQMIYGKEDINSNELEILINWFIIILIFVFDPVALILIITYLELTDRNKQDKNNFERGENNSEKKDKKNKNDIKKETKENIQIKNEINKKDSSKEKIQNIENKENLNKKIVIEKKLNQNENKQKIIENENDKSKEKETKIKNNEKKSSAEKIRENIKEMGELLEPKTKHTVPQIRTWFNDNNGFSNYKYNF